MYQLVKIEEPISKMSRQEPDFNQTESAAILTGNSRTISKKQTDNRFNYDFIRNKLFLSE